MAISLSFAPAGPRRPLAPERLRASSRARKPCSQGLIARSAAPDGLTLFSHPMSRGKICEWYIAELGADVAMREISMEDKEHKEDWFLRDVNPFGVLPCLQGDGVSLFESGAILMFLADKFGEVESAAERAELAKWVIWANSTMGNAIYIDKNRDAQMPALMKALDGVLAASPYLIGGEFSAADVAVGSYLLYVPLFFPDVDFSQWPNVQAYLERLGQRPAYQATLGARIASMPPPPTRRRQDNQAA